MGFFFFCLRERWCRSLLVCKCSSSCFSWRCAWGKLKIGHAHLWASCLFTAFGNAFASPLSALSVLLFSSLSQSSCCYRSPSTFLLFLVPESSLVCLASPVLAWKTCNGTPLPFTMVHYPTWWETRTLWHSTENVKSHESWIQLFVKHIEVYIHPKYRRSGGGEKDNKFRKCVIENYA